MKNMKPPVNCFKLIAGMATFVAIICAASINIASATDTNAPPLAISVSSPTNAPAASAKKDLEPPKKLTGVELYAIHCNRCHPERYPTEFNEGEWKTIMMHMRVRANLSG